MEEQRAETEEEHTPAAEEEAPPAGETPPADETAPKEEPPDGEAPTSDGREEPEEEQTQTAEKRDAPDPVDAPDEQTDGEAEEAEPKNAEPEEPEPEATAEKRTPPQRRPPSMVLRVALALAGLILLSGFFLPWVTIGKVADISGLELVINNENLPSSQRIILALCPLVAVALTLAGVLGFRGSVWVGIIAGAAVLAYALFTIAYILYQMIDVGLWMVLASALIAFAGGIFSKLWAAKKTREQAAAP